MTRQEFITQLRIALQGTIPQEQVNEHLRYYENYIMEEARKGQTEEQVVAALGDPRLIAKTLSMTDASRRGGSNRKDSGYFGQEESYSGQADGPEGRSLKKRGFLWNSWYKKAAVIAIAVLVVVVIAQVVAFLLPIVIPVVLVLMLVSFLLGGRKR